MVEFEGRIEIMLCRKSPLSNGLIGGKKGGEGEDDESWKSKMFKKMAWRFGSMTKV